VNRFNLSFRGEILPGSDPAAAREGFARLFDVDDAQQLEQFFSGDPVVLLHNLERKVAAEYYLKLNQLGLNAELVKTDPAADTSPSPAVTPVPAARDTPPAASRDGPDPPAQTASQISAPEQVATTRSGRSKPDEAGKLQQHEASLRKEAVAARHKAAAQKAGRTAARQASTEPAASASELEEKAIAAGARALSGNGNIKPVRARARSRLELPRKSRKGQTATRRNPPGSPNPYRLQAFRSTADVRLRATQASSSARRGMAVAGIALATLLILLGRFLSLTPSPLIEGPTAVAASASGELLMLVGDSLLQHDRAGVAVQTLTAEAMGVTAFAAPMLFDSTGRLLLAANDASNSQPGLWRCDLDAQHCEGPSADYLKSLPAAMTLHELSDQRFVATDGQLIKLSPGGEVVATTELMLPEKPVLRLDSGLLFVNSSQGPAISVLRYEDASFGQQLDEILLMPPPALEREQSRVRDFIRNGDFWWVELANPVDDSSGLYLFDRDWKYVRELPRDGFTANGQLLKWGERVLYYSRTRGEILRYNKQGLPEAPLVSPLLMDIIGQDASHRLRVNALWQVLLALLVLTSLAGAAWAYLQSARALVYSGRPARGADPLDDIASELQWLETAPNRATQLRQLNITLAIVSLALLTMLIGLGVSLLQLIAATAFLTGPAIALQIFIRSEQEHAGFHEEQVVLVDHREMYHLAQGPRIQYRGPFVLIDDVVIFTGNTWLPSLNPLQVRKQLEPRVTAGVRVDRKTVAVKLLQSRHPLAQGVVAIVGCTLLATLLLLLSFIPVLG